MRKISRTLTLAVVAFFAIGSLYACGCAYAASATNPSAQEMDCHGSATDAASNTSKSSECCGKCQVENTAVLKTSASVHKVMPVSLQGGFIGVANILLTHPSVSSESSFLFSSSPFYEGTILSSNLVRGPPLT